MMTSVMDAESLVKEANQSLEAKLVVPSMGIRL